MTGAQPSNHDHAYCRLDRKLSHFRPMGAVIAHMHHFVTGFVTPGNVASQESF